MDTPAVRANARQQFRLKPTFRRALGRLNMSQNDFAREVNVTSGYMSQLVTGRRCAGPRIRRRLMAVTELTFDDLFEEVVRP